MVPSLLNTTISLSLLTQDIHKTTVYVTWTGMAYSNSFLNQPLKLLWSGPSLRRERIIHHTILGNGNLIQKESWKIYFSYYDTTSNQGRKKSLKANFLSYLSWVSWWRNISPVHWKRRHCYRPSSSSMAVCSSNHHDWRRSLIWEEQR